jgi:hypothetical protein
MPQNSQRLPARQTTASIRTTARPAMQALRTQGADAGCPGYIDFWVGPHLVNGGGAAGARGRSGRPVRITPSAATVPLLADREPATQPSGWVPLPLRVPKKTFRLAASAPLTMRTRWATACCGSIRSSSRSSRAKRSRVSAPASACRNPGTPISSVTSRRPLASPARLSSPGARSAPIRPGWTTI